MIFKCDLVVTEAQKILLISNKLKRSYSVENPSKISVEKFCKSIEENLPRFSAARFFDVSRSTIMNILGCVVSFFIVMIQLRHNSYN